MSELTQRLVRYAFTGGAAAVIDIGGFALLSSVRVPVVLAATVSFLAAAIVNYLLTSRLVFQEAATVRRFGAFLAGTLLTLVINVSITSAGVIYLSLPHTLSKIIAVGTTFFISFWVNANLVFSGRSAHAATTSEGDIV